MRDGRDGKDGRGEGPDRGDVASDVPAGKHSRTERIGPTAHSLPGAGRTPQGPELGIGKQSLVEREFGAPNRAPPPHTTGDRGGDQLPGLAYIQEHFGRALQRKATGEAAPDSAAATDSASRGVGTADTAGGDGAVHRIAAAGVSGTGGPLPLLENIQRAFGPAHDVSHVEAHVGGAAGDAAAQIGARAYATGNSVAFAEAPDVHTAAHEAAHVVQQHAGVRLKGGVGAEGDAYERHADAVADRVVAGRSAEDLLEGGTADAPTHAVQRKEAIDDAKLLENQASLKGPDVEIPALEGALLATRKEAVKQGLLSQASFNAGLALSQAMTQLQPAVAAKGAVDKALQNAAAVAAQRLFVALQKETADEKNFKPLPSAGEGAAITSQNPYTEEVQLTTGFLFRATTHDLGSWFQKLPDLIRQGAWEEAFRGYRRMLDGLDLWVADQLRKKGKGTPEEALGNAHQHHAQLRTGLEQIAGKHATRLPALFHPDARTVEKEKAAGRPAADTIPMNVYFWRDAADGKFHLYDLTTPGRPHEQTIDSQPTAAMLNTFFEEVARYPEGEVRYTLPGGAAGVAPTTGKTKWFEWLGYAGMAIAAAGLAFLTAGASIPATVCFAAGAVAGGISAGGHLVDTASLGTATTTTVVLDVAQIVASFASFGALSITVKAGGATGAVGSSRWFVPLVTTAAGADVVQLAALTDLTLTELHKIQRGGGTPEDQQRAMAVLLTQLIVMGGMTALSVQGARNLRGLAGTPLEVVEQNGAKVLRVAGEDTPAPVAGSKSGAKAPEGGAAARSSEKVPSLTIAEAEGSGVVHPSRDARLKELARDPAQGGAVIPKTLREAEVGLSLEEAGRLPKPITRDPTGGAEFIDGTNQAWDVKRFNSSYPPKQGGYTLESSLAKIKRELDNGENVIVDTIDLKPEHVAELRAGVSANGWDARVVWY